MLKKIEINLAEISENYLIEFLPGIFYIYEQVGDNFELIHWNKNHEIVTGYNAKEIARKNVFDFFYEFDYPTIVNGLGEIIRTGKVKQVFAHLKLKSGKTLPYIFEGYQFFYLKKLFFLGVGIDMSEIVETREKLDLAQVELMKKNKELFSFTLEKVELSQTRSLIKKKINHLLALNDLEAVKKELNLLNQSLTISPKRNELWEIFRLRFNEIHQDFFKKLRTMHPDISNSELKYCAYLKINLSPDQISSLLNIGKEGIKKKRYRIRKKFDLERDSSLEDYLENL